MTLEQEADFKITATWQDDASAPMVRSTEKMNLAWKNLRKEQQFVTRSFEVNNRTLLATSRVVSTVTGVVSRGVQVFQAYTLMQIRAQDATRNLNEEQRKLDDTLAEFGPASKEYRDQLLRVKEAEEELERTTRDNLIGTFLNVALILGTMSGAITRVIPRLKLLSSAMKGVTGTAPVKSPVAPTSTTSGTGPLGKVGKALGNFGKKIPGGLSGIGAGAAGSALFLAQLMGEQNASAPLSDAQGNEIPDNGRTVSDNGLDNLMQVGKDIIVTVNNFINSPTPDDIAKDIEEATSRAMTFSAQ